MTTDLTRTDVPADSRNIDADRELIKAIAMDIGKDVVAYVEVMYPKAVEATSSTFKLSLRNCVYNEIMAALEVIDADEIRTRLEERKKFRRQWTKTYRDLRKKDGGSAAAEEQTPRPFPILYPTRPPTDAPRSIPWSLVALHRAQAQINHVQTLESLAERGGLAPCELLAVLEDRSHLRMHLEDAIRQLRALCDAFDLGAAAERAKLETAE
ncbi:hypothetical protein D3093_35440 (plasmid) [Azospirillum argentinense]|uniref:Uncharacterized protein n=1 Tax=Azospirillum argentinense TaxID=2970906 RepID=A0A4D8Q0V1_9PROT|nr:hypothetical protein [Azospirillum argentinense]QCO00540.1 hypothetical protein D3093_35440 [Azospirillum argentinense]